MNGKKEVREMLRKQGFIDRKEAAALLGKVDGGSILIFLKKHNVRSVGLGFVEDGERDSRMFLEVDVQRARQESEGDIPVGGESNGGRLHKLIRELAERVETLEKWKADWE